MLKLLSSYTVPAIEPVVLLRGIARARAGRVTTTLFEHTVYPAFGVTTRLGERRYEFFLQCEPQPPVEGQRQDRCDLSLRSESIEQVLASYGTYYEGDNQIFAAEVPPRIVWAGDLNRDGRLDVLLDTSDHYNVREMRLYLSTADASSLVKEVAGYSTSGC